MRKARIFTPIFMTQAMLAGAACIVSSLATPSWAQTLPRALTQPAAPAAAAPAAPAAPATPAPTVAAAPAASVPKEPCANPNAIGVSRVVAIDTTGGPGFGFEHFKQMDFLRDKEVVFTFDDGPWPVNTPGVLKILAEECTKALFFPIGKHATYHPEILKQVAAAGHTIGSHTWGHIQLTGKTMTDDKAKAEIEMGISAVAWALGKPPAPFFRFPALQHPPTMMTYLGERNVGIWSTDIDSFDFKNKNAKKIIERVMALLERNGKGILLMHDFQRPTLDALPELMTRLKAGGYKVVQITAKLPLKTIPEYDEMLAKEAKFPTAPTRPVSSVVETISE